MKAALLKNRKVPSLSFDRGNSAKKVVINVKVSLKFHLKRNVWKHYAFS